MSFAFEVIVRTRSDAGSGVVTEVMTSGLEPQYKVHFSSGSQFYSARHLELATQGAGSNLDPAALLRDGVFADAPPSDPSCRSL